jgi:hypothetical protein
MQQSDDDDDAQKDKQMIIASVQYPSRKALEKVAKLERENEELFNSINKNNQLKEELLRTIQKAEETLRLYGVQVQVQQQLPDQFAVSNNNDTLSSPIQQPSLVVITNEQQQQIKPSKQQRKKTWKSTRNDQQKQQQPTITPSSSSSTTTNKRMKPFPNNDTEMNFAKEIDALEFVMELWDELYDQDENIYTEYDSDDSKRKTWYQVLSQ